MFSLLFIDKEKGVLPDANLRRSEFIIVESFSSSGVCSLFVVARGLLSVSGITPSLLSSSEKKKINIIFILAKAVFV